MAKEPKAAKKAPGEGRKSLSNTPATVEKVFAFYCVTQNYHRTARKFGLPVSTVFGMVNERAGGPEELERIRTARRADMIEKAFKAASKLIPVITPGNCGSVATSKAADASRAMEALVRAGHLMTPKVENAENVAPTEIHIHTGMQRPPELDQPAPVGETTTTTLKENE